MQGLGTTVARHNPKPSGPPRNQSLFAAFPEAIPTRPLVPLKAKSRKPLTIPSRPPTLQKAKRRPEDGRDMPRATQEGAGRARGQCPSPRHFLFAVHLLGSWDPDLRNHHPPLSAVQLGHQGHCSPLLGRVVGQRVHIRLPAASSLPPDRDPQCQKWAPP